MQCRERGTEREEGRERESENDDRKLSFSSVLSREKSDDLWHSFVSAPLRSKQPQQESTMNRALNKTSLKQLVRI